MKTQLLKSIFFYLLASIFYLLKANAQIVYTDIPDTTLSNGTVYHLDLNNDGTADFNIQYSTYTINFSSCGGTRTNLYYKIYPLHGDAIQNGGSYPLPISQNNSISGSSFTWNTDSVQLLSSIVYSCGHSWGFTTSGNWSPDDEGYLGLKLIANGNSYYGWTRIFFMGYNIIIKDYAFNSTPNQQIKTGQTASATAFMTTLGSTEYCTGNSISIPYQITGTFNSGNIFTAQLSDSTGNFSSPLNIGTHAGQNAGSINVTFPFTAKSSHLYRIRIASSNPASIGPDNAQELSIGIVNNITSYQTVICQPGSAYLSAHGSSPSYSYQWTKNGISISGATSASYTTSTGGNFACTITNSCGTVNSNVISLNVGSYPAATITPSGTAEACPGSTATLYANTGTGLTYQWYKNIPFFGLTSIAGATSATYAANATISYQVRVTNSSGCSSLSTYKDVYIRTPQASISNSRPLTFCAGDSTVLKTTNNSSYLYQWKKNNVNIPGAISYKYTAFTSGNYKVKVTNQNGNCDSISKVKTVTVNCRMADENIVESLEHISIFPNPTTNSITIKFPSDEEGTIQIVNLFGQIVFSEKIFSDEMKVDLSKFSGGMYVVRWSVRTPSESSGGNNETKTFSVIK